jgi:hypothetical protein
MRIVLPILVLLIPDAFLIQPAALAPVDTAAVLFLIVAN